MTAKYLIAISCFGLASVAAASSSVAYNGMQADMAACMQGQGKVSKAVIVRGCSNLIDNAAKENEVVGYFYALRATANTDKRSNCRDARKALQLLKNPKLLQSVRMLEKNNC